MRYGSANVEKVIDGDKHTITIHVGVERPADRTKSYIRCAEGVPESGAAVGALSGARFARHKIDCDNFGIEFLQVSGDVNSPEAYNGAAIASAAAIWTAHGVAWQEADLGNMDGWTLRESSAPPDRGERGA